MSHPGHDTKNPSAPAPHSLRPWAPPAQTAALSRPNPSGTPGQPSPSGSATGRSPPSTLLPAQSLPSTNPGPRSTPAACKTRCTATASPPPCAKPPRPAATAASPASSPTPAAHARFPPPIPPPLPPIPPGRPHRSPRLPAESVGQNPAGCPWDHLPKPARPIARAMPNKGGESSSLHLLAACPPTRQPKSRPGSRHPQGAAERGAPK